MSLLSFSKARITLIPKPDTLQEKKKYTLTPFKNINAYHEHIPESLNTL